MNTVEPSTHKLSLHAAEDLSPALTAGDALLQDYTLNADILNELLDTLGVQVLALAESLCFRRLFPMVLISSVPTVLAVAVFF